LVLCSNLDTQAELIKTKLEAQADAANVLETHADKALINQVCVDVFQGTGFVEPALWSLCMQPFTCINIYNPVFGDAQLSTIGSVRVPADVQCIVFQSDNCDMALEHVVITIHNMLVWPPVIKVPSYHGSLFCAFVPMP
jgi:hypothetical protein